jgi:predicted transglutaminase-like cysteine proteinase
MARQDYKWPSQFDGWQGQSKPPSYDEQYEVEFQWGASGRLLSGGNHVALELPVDLYEYCTNRARVHQYGVYVADPFQEPFLNDVLDNIREPVSDAHDRSTELLETVIEFVQSLDYTLDVDDTGHMAYPKYPIETLRHQQGDCEDGTILLGSLLYTLGYDVALLPMPAEHHMVLGVALDDHSGASVTHNGTEYYLLETTATGWDLGNVPAQYAGAQVEFHLPDKHPVLVHEWEAVPDGNARVKVSCHLANFGNGPATYVHAQFGFERRNGDVETGLVFDQGFSIQPGKSVNYTEPLRLAPETKLQGVCTIGINGDLHDESRSDWR